MTAPAVPPESKFVVSTSSDATALDVPAGDLRVPGVGIADHLGIDGIVVPSLHQIDWIALADPVGAHIRLDQRGRPGHEVH